VNSSGGKNPVWNQQLPVFSDISDQTEVTFKIHNKRTLLSDDLLGSVSVSFERLKSNWTSLELPLENGSLSVAIHLERPSVAVTSGAVFIQIKDSDSDTDFDIYSDDHGRTALHWAALHGNLSEVRQLVLDDAEVNATTNSGLTALHYASWCGRPKCVDFLLENGADWTLQSTVGETAYAKSVDERAYQNLEDRAAVQAIFHTYEITK